MIPCSIPKKGFGILLRPSSLPNHPIGGVNEFLKMLETGLPKGR